MLHGAYLPFKPVFYFGEEGEMGVEGRRFIVVFANDAVDLR